MSPAARRALHADLRRLAGEDAVLPDADAGPYERGYRYGAGRAAAVVRPASVEAVSAVLRFAGGQELRVVPQGANTGLVGASTPGPDGTDIVLSLDRLRRIERLDAADRTLTAQAGARLSEVNLAADAAGLWLPIDLGADPSIGGMVATNTGGTRQLRYGGMRRRLLGLEAVMADGTVLSDLRGLRKDNSGVDLKQLFVGTGGAFGVVTRAVVELAPRLRRTVVALVAPTHLDAIPEILRRAEMELGDLLTAFEGVSREALEACLRHQPGLANPFAPDPLPPYVVLIELGSTDVRRDLEAILLLFLGDLSEGPAPLVEDGRLGPPDRFWALRHAISDSLRREGRLIAFDVSVTRSGLPAFRAEVVEQLARAFPSIRVCDFGHWGDGGLHLNLVAPGTDPEPEVTERGVRDLVYAVVEAHGGSFSAEHGVGPVNLAYYRRYAPAARRRLSGSLKTLLDPDHRLGAVDLA